MTYLYVRHTSCWSSLSLRDVLLRISKLYPNWPRCRMRIIGPESLGCILVVILVRMWPVLHSYFLKIITYFLNSGHCSRTQIRLDVWESIRNFIPPFIGHLITYPWWDKSWTKLVKDALYKYNLSKRRTPWYDGFVRFGSLCFNATCWSAVGCKWEKTYVCLGLTCLFFPRRLHGIMKGPKYQQQQKN